MIGCTDGTGIHNEQATSDFQPEIDKLKDRVAQLESRLVGLEKPAPVPDDKAPDAVVVPPSMTIWSAAAKGNRKEIELHIVTGTDLDSPDNIGQASLHHAAANNQAYIIKLLLANGADANVTDDKGDTALDWAESWNRTEVADLLRGHGGKTKNELGAVGK
ncbi:MAG: ankyrin repeat domain-containing protein [Verrucomicrobiota bacterium]|nr:ankyrin repeat domain-containing protein [Verrucomicrobiota bacterium]